MTTPLSLRIARLLLVGAAAASVGVVVVIASRASGISPLLAVFIAAAAGFVIAARLLATDPRRARLVAVSSALALAGMAVLTGFGGGDVSFPAAGVGVLAAWAALLHPPRSAWAIAFVAYLAFGVVLLAPRYGLALAYPWQLATIFTWPIRLLLPFGPPLLMIFAPLGAAVALAFVAARDQVAPWKSVRVGRRAIVLAAVSGLVATAIYVALAFSRPDTSAAAELSAIPIAIVFAAGAAVTFGIAAYRGAPLLAALSLAAGATAALVIVTERPTVSCTRDGVSTTGGPWWLGDARHSSGSGRSTIGGTVGGSGESSGTRSTGEIRRGDTIVMRYECADGRLVEFMIVRDR